VLTLMIPNSSQKPSSGPATWETLLAGFRYIWDQPIVLGAISLDLAAVILGGATALLPVFARDILEVGPWGLGLLRSAPGIGAVAMGIWLVRSKRAGKLTLIDPDLFRSANFRLGISGQTLQQIALGGAMIALPIFLQMVLGYDAMETGLSIAPLSLSMFAVALIAGKRAGRRRPASVIRMGFGLLCLGMLALIPIVPRAESGWWLTIPLIIAGSGLGLLVSQLNNYTLSPIEGERVSEAAGVNSAAGSFGLSFGLAFAGAIMLATLSLTFTPVMVTLRVSIVRSPENETTRWKESCAEPRRVPMRNG